MRTATIPSLHEYRQQAQRRERQAQEAALRRQQEAENRERRERESEARLATQLIELRYEAYIRPALREWLNLSRNPDPLRNPGEAFSLLIALARRNVEYTQKVDTDCFTVLLTMPIRGGWVTGRGTGDSLQEALTLAMWEMIQNAE